MFTNKKDFLSSLQIKDTQTLESLFATADILKPVSSGKKITKILDGAVIANLFFEPSTRTRLSFETAVIRLGGQSITVTGTDLISVVKGESYTDTARVISGYADIIVLRTSSPVITDEFATGSIKPVINAGSGGDEHPTQALLDVYTAQQELEARGKTLNNAHIALVGDLKYGRTIHSLVKLLRLYNNITFHLISPQGLELPANIIEIAKNSGHHIIQHAPTSLADAIAQADIIYTTRLQKERLSADEKIECYPDYLCLNTAAADTFAKKDVIIMHPLPRDSRVGANDLLIAANDPRLAIFKQTDNGVAIRMALLCKVLGIFDKFLVESLTPVKWL